MGEDIDELRRKVHRTMERDGFCSVMNDTKWRELCVAFYGGSPPTCFRRRDLLAAPNRVWAWDGEWYYHPRPYLTIEWLDITVAGGGSDLSPVLEVLERVGTVYEQTAERVVRVYGYTRADHVPARRATEA